ncbi:histidine phosphatase family protein [Xylophilus sp. GW821-FHT01B05]
MPIPANPALLFGQCAAAHRWVPAAQQFYFLRHGQTARNALRIFQGPEEPLDATGQAQAERAGHTLAATGVPITSIAFSDMLRTQQTAEAVSRHLPTATRLPLPDLRERNFGALIGTSSEQLAWDCDPVQGETLAQFVERTAAGLQTALALPGPVLVVAHGGTLHALAALLQIKTTAALFANAHPLQLAPGADGWTATALAAAAADQRRDLS